MPFREKATQLWGRRGEAAKSVLDVTIKGLEASKDVVASAALVPGLSVALNMAVEFLKKIQDAETNREEIKGLCEETAALGRTLQRLAEMVQDGFKEAPDGSLERQTQEDSFKANELGERLERLQSDLRGICEDAGGLSRRRYFGRLLHSSSDAKAVSDMKDKVATARQNFQLEGGILTENIVTKTLSDIKTAEMERILSSIPKADEALYRSAVNAMKARFVKGTRERLFEALEEWRRAQIDGDSTTPICTLIGEAGTGKSTVASEFARRSEGRGCLGASFFFTRGGQDVNSPRKFFSTISSQLAQSQSALTIPIANAARKHLKAGTLQQLEYEFLDLIQTPLNHLPSDHPPFFLIVDALDECTEEGPELVPTLLKLLLSYVAQPGCPMRVLLTSRPEPYYIHRELAVPSLQSRIAFIDIQNYRSSVDEDIELLIRGRLEEDDTSESWSAADPFIVKTLVSRADGLFVYARTAVDFILTDVSSLQERYKVVTSADDSFKLAPLTALYRNLMEAAFPAHDQYPQRRKNMRAVLEYLVTMQTSEAHPVSPHTLELLTGMPAADLIPILNALRSVVFFKRDDPSSPFRIIHATFREFLTNEHLSREAFYVNTASSQVHAELAHACVRTLESFWQAQRPGEPHPQEASVCGFRQYSDLFEGLHPLEGDFSHVHYAFKSYLYHCLRGRIPICFSSASEGQSSARLKSRGHGSALGARTPSTCSLPRESL